MAAKAKTLAAAELTLQRPALLARTLPGRAAAVLRHRRRAHAPCRSELSRRTAAAKTAAVVRSTPAEVDGLSNGGAGQKGRLECLYIISLLRRPLIFLPNASGELLATGNHRSEREKAYAVDSQLDWNVRPRMWHCKT